MTGQYAWRHGFTELGPIGTGDVDCLGRLYVDDDSDAATSAFIDLPAPLTLGDPANRGLLSDRLSSLGYATHLVGKWHLGASALDCYPEHRGFDAHFGLLGGAHDHFGHFDGAQCAGADPRWPCVVAPALDGYDLRDASSTSSAAVPYALAGLPASPSADGFSSNLFGARAAEVVAAHDATTSPLFLLFAPTAPHVPLQADPQDLDAAACADAFPDAATDPQRWVCALMRGLDRAVDVLVDALETATMWPDTILLFASDNGAPAAFSNAPLRGTKLEYYDGALRVPAFFAGGRVPHKTLAPTAFVDMTDVLPTLLGAAGAADAASGTDGRDLSAQLFVPNDDDADLATTLTPPRDIVLTTERDVNVSIPVLGVDFLFRTGGLIAHVNGTVYKYVITPQRPLGEPVRGEVAELYALIDDPYETTNLVDDEPAVAAVLKAKLATYTTQQTYGFKSGPRNIVTAPPGLAYAPYNNCWLGLDDPGRDDATLSCAGLLPARTPIPDLPGFGIGIQCVGNRTVAYRAEVDCAAA